MIPAADAAIMAANTKNQLLDENREVTLGYHRYIPHLQPGVSLTLNLDYASIADQPYMIVQKMYFGGNWNQVPIYGLANVVHYKLAYFDPNASPYRLPNSSIVEKEKIESKLNLTNTDTRRNLY